LNPVVLRGLQGLLPDWEKNRWRYIVMCFVMISRHERHKPVQNCTCIATLLGKQGYCHLV